MTDYPTFTPLNGRTVELGATYDVYRNLNEQKRTGAMVWSLRARTGTHKGKVVGHARTIALADAIPHVGIKAQQRIAAGAPREVHAWITGKLTALPDTAPVRRVTYRPHESAQFRYCDNGTTFLSAATVAFNANGMFGE